MNIKINEKFVSLLLLGTMGVGTVGFTLCSCSKAEEEVNISSFTLDEIITDIEEDSYIDDALIDDTITLTNPFNGDIRVMNMLDASKYLENLLEISLKLEEMNIDLVDKDDEYYYMVENIASTWSIDDARDMINDVYFGDDALSKLSIGELRYYKGFLYEELKGNGMDIVIRLLGDSIDNSSEDTTEYSEILDSIENLRDNREELDYMSFYDIYSLIDNGFEKSKEVIAISGNKKIKIKTNG